MRFDRFGAQDGSEEMDERIYELLRQKTPEERLRMTVDRMEFMRRWRAATEHLRDPSAKRHT